MIRSRQLTLLMDNVTASVSVALALEAARNAIAKLDEFEWPAYSDREGNAIAGSEKALREVVAQLEQAARALGPL